MKRPELEALTELQQYQHRYVHHYYWFPTLQKVPCDLYYSNIDLINLETGRLMVKSGKSYTIIKMSKEHISYLNSIFPICTQLRLI